MYSGEEEEEKVGRTAVRHHSPTGLDWSCAVGLQLTGPEVGVGAHHAHDQ